MPLISRGSPRQAGRDAPGDISPKPPAPGPLLCGSTRLSFIFPANLEGGKRCCIVYASFLEVIRPPSGESLHLFCLRQELPWAHGALYGDGGPQGVLCASNYEESTTATWFQGRRHRQGFLPLQLRARGQLSLSRSSAVSLHPTVSPGLCLAWTAAWSSFLVTSVRHQTSKKQTRPE